ncbi:unnamed protein product [Protopolystoma xenopodis]|uniref:BHLH domain-containing protein n=1 Tax=Protopolystoma xenopodis TaxID=117903 RepID=A0A448X0S1_9PLAT|nr:unnamed protein product [Protopolystoma xenopodis]
MRINSLSCAQVNTAFDSLRRVVPKGHVTECQRLSKIATLRLAIQYIRAMHRLLGMTVPLQSALHRREILIHQPYQEHQQQNLLGYSLQTCQSQRGLSMGPYNQPSEFTVSSEELQKQIFLDTPIIEQTLSYSTSANGIDLPSNNHCYLIDREGKSSLSQPIAARVMKSDQEEISILAYEQIEAAQQAESRVRHQNSTQNSVHRELALGTGEQRRHADSEHVLANWSVRDYRLGRNGRENVTTQQTRAGTAKTSKKVFVGRQCPTGSVWIMKERKRKENRDEVEVCEEVRNEEVEAWKGNGKEIGGCGSRNEEYDETEEADCKSLLLLTAGGRLDWPTLRDIYSSTCSSSRIQHDIDKEHVKGKSVPKPIIALISNKLRNSCRERYV